MLVAGIIAATATIWRVSNAAFTATTSNGANTFSTGTVVISSSPGTALFTVSGLKPGSTGSACLTVTYGGSLAAAVRLYGTSASATNSLDSFITFQIDETTGAGGTVTGPACTGLGATTPLFDGTLASFASTKTSYATGLGSWAPTSTASKDYRITYTLAGSAPGSAQNGTAGITLTWEASNT